MPHPLVNQLRFTRGEFERCIQGVSEIDAVKRIAPMNCISWIVGHLANQENRYWVGLGQSKLIFPELNTLVGYGQPATTPPLSEMWAIWHEVTRIADQFLDNLTITMMQTHFQREGKPVPENIGTLLQRNIYHYWFHTGEAHAIRQLIGHLNLPDFVGNMEKAIYIPEKE